MTNRAEARTLERIVRKAAIVLVAVALSIGALDIASPYVTLARLKAAADRRDGPALARFIDFPAVQASIGAQLEQHFAEVVATDRGKSTARTVSGIFGMLLSKNLVEVAVNEATIGRLIRGADGIVLPVAGPRTLHFDPKRYRLVRTSFSDFWVCPANVEKDIALRFQRSFPGWRITQITLPRRLFGVEGSSLDGCG